MKTLSSTSTRGFTIAEMMVAACVMAFVGVMIFLVLNSGMVLYAKNTAVNSGHQQARAGIDQMLANIHSSVSIPQLVDANLQPTPEIDNVTKQPIPAAGISFQTFYAGPFPVTLNANATDTSVTLYCPGNYTIGSNMRLNIPSHQIELNIVSTNFLGGGIRVFNFSSPIGTNVSISGTGIEGAGTSYVISAFLTTRISYAVIGNELRYFPTNGYNNAGVFDPTDATLYKVITRNVVSKNPPNPPAPFSIPIQPSGGLQNRFVAAVDLSTAEPQFSQRGYAAVNMFISSLIPFRCRLTNLQ